MGAIAPGVMRFGVLTEKGHAEVHERPLPEPGPEEALIRQEACNICTTDYQQWLGQREGRGYPIACGHECAGTVIKTGEKVRDLQCGDQVALAYITCGICEGCKRGIGCSNNEIGPRQQSHDGYRGIFGYADYAVRPARALVKIKRELSPGEAAFMEPLATVMKGLEKLRVKALETVVVIGAGTMGLLNAQAARAFGCRVIVSELLDNKIALARSLGFEVIDGKTAEPASEVMRLTDKAGADAVIVAVAAAQANQQALDMAKHLDGRILYFAAGYPAPEIKIDSNIIHYRRLELIGTFGAELPHFYAAADMLNQDRVKVSQLLEGSRYPLEKIQDAFAEAARPGKYRVSVLLN
ncbi:alcohol dehydrogenase [Spirochaetia bacterium]|nr:alcohol dehydrogenase [Spirochaetia bacterium]